MSSKRIALLIAKFGFCAITAILLWTHPASAAASEGQNFACPPHCIPAGLHCLCP